MRVLTRFNGYEFDDDRARVDRDALWSFLSAEAYWARWRSRADVETQLANAWRIVGVYDESTDEMVGYARAVSDGVSFAYLADVYVHSDARSNGLGKELVRVMIDAGPGPDMRWTLHTADAHGLYRQFGFAEPDSTYLERPSRIGTSQTDDAFDRST